MYVENISITKIKYQEDYTHAQLKLQKVPAPRFELNWSYWNCGHGGPALQRATDLVTRHCLDPIGIQPQTATCSICHDMDSQLIKDEPVTTPSDQEILLRKFPH